MMTANQQDMTQQQVLERAFGDRSVVGGADTHADTVHIAAIDQLGRPLGDREFATTPAGYRAALAFLREHGTLSEVGVEAAAPTASGSARFCGTVESSSVKSVALTAANDAARASPTRSTPTRPPAPSWTGERARSPRASRSSSCGRCSTPAHQRSRPPPRR